MRLLIMLPVRPAELVQMRWEDVDLVGADWRYVVSKTKHLDKSKHIVPLPEQALVLLRELHKTRRARTVVIPPHARCAWSCVCARSTAGTAPGGGSAMGELLRPIAAKRGASDGRLTIRRIQIRRLERETRLAPGVLPIDIHGISFFDEPKKVLILDLQGFWMLPVTNGDIQIKHPHRNLGSEWYYSPPRL